MLPSSYPEREGGSSLAVLRKSAARAKYTAERLRFAVRYRTRSEVCPTCCYPNKRMLEKTVPPHTRNGTTIAQKTTARYGADLFSQGFDARKNDQ